jgi:hypothetical protein
MRALRQCFLSAMPDLAVAQWLTSFTANERNAFCQAGDLTFCLTTGPSEGDGRAPACVLRRQTFVHTARQVK